MNFYFFFYNTFNEFRSFKIKIYNTETIIIKQIIYSLRVSTLTLHSKVPRVSNPRFRLTWIGVVYVTPDSCTESLYKSNPYWAGRDRVDNAVWNMRITNPTCGDLWICMCFRFNSKSGGMQNVLRRIVAALVILCPVIAFSIPESAIQASSIKSSQTEQVHTTIILRNRSDSLHFRPGVPPARPSTAKE